MYFPGSFERDRPREIVHQRSKALNQCKAQQGIGSDAGAIYSTAPSQCQSFGTLLSASMIICHSLPVDEIQTLGRIHA